MEETSYGSNVTSGASEQCFTLEGVSPEEQIERVRRICIALPETIEKLSHGEPTFFVKKKVYAMIANNHHNDGHVAAWIPIPPGLKPMLMKKSPKKYYNPPYVGVKGWIGVELAQVSDQELAAHLLDAWRLIAPSKLVNPPATSR